MDTPVSAATDTGSVPATAPVRPATPSPTAALSASAAPVRSNAASATTSATSVTSSVGSPVIRLRLPGGRSAPVVPVTVEVGALAVPADPSVLGWWATGARPGSGVGSVVVDGHVDSARTGLGVFARLRTLDVGQQVALTDSTGRVFTYRITGRRSYPKATLADADVVDQTVPERLVMVTCGGAFDRSTRHYADNVVVYAVPIAGG